MYQNLAIDEDKNDRTNIMHETKINKNEIRIILNK